jgi:hypothetical protein
MGSYYVAQASSAETSNECPTPDKTQKNKKEKKRKTTKQRSTFLLGKGI